MAGLTERLAVIIEASGIGAINEFRKVGATAQAELAKVDKATKGTRDSTGLLSTALNKMGLQSISTGQALGVGLAVAATAAAVSAVKLGEGYLHATEQVRQFSEITGASAEDSSKLRNATKALGIDLDSTSTVFLRFTRNIGESPQKLAAFGVAIAHTKQGTTDVVGTLGNVADALQHIPDPARRAQLEVAAFGQRGIIPLLPLLAQGKQGIEALTHTGPVFNEAELQKAQQFQIATREVHNTLSAFGNLIGKVVVTSVSGYALALDRLTGGHGRAAAAAELHASAETKVAEAVDKASSNLVSAVQAENSAQRARADANFAVGQAEQSLTDARDNLNQLLRKGAVDAKQVAAAQYQLAQADRSVADAEKNLAQVRAGATADELARAGIGRDEAKLGITDAAVAVKAARRSFTQALQSGDSLAIAQARQGLAHALLSQKAAAVSLDEAQKNLTDTENKGKEGTDAVTQAERQLTDAEHARAQSLDALHTAEVGNVNFASEVKKAREAVATATHGLANAQDSAQQTAEAFALSQQKANDALNAALPLGAQLANQLEEIYGLYPGLRPLLDQLEGLLDPNAGRAGITTANPVPANFVGPVAGRDTKSAALQNFNGPVVRDTISILPPGLSLAYNATGKPETIVNADLLRGGGGGTSTMTVNIHMPPGSDGEDVVAAIKRYERRNGSAWRNN